METSAIYAPMSIGELYDKITILQIKLLELPEEKLENVNKELDQLRPIFELVQVEGRRENSEKEEELIKNLMEANTCIWRKVDEISKHSNEWSRIMSEGLTYDFERIKGAAHLGIEIFDLNNSRFEAKKAIDDFYGCDIKEEKSCTW